MARIRSIKPETRTSILVASWPFEMRYFWVLLWGYLDDKGRGLDVPKQIAGDCFPHDEKITASKVDKWLTRMTVGLNGDEGPVCRYLVNGRRYIHSVNWDEHQKPNRPTPSRLPPCPIHEGLSEGLPEPDSEPDSEDNPGPEDLPTGNKHRPNENEVTGRSRNQTLTSIHPVNSEDQKMVSSAKKQVTGSRLSESLNGPSTGPQFPEQGSRGAEELEDYPPSGGSTRARTRGTRLPADFAATPAMVAWARAECPDVDGRRATASFVDYWSAKTGKDATKHDWVATWRNWLRKDQTDAERRRPQAPNAGYHSQTDANIAAFLGLDDPPKLRALPGGAS